MFWYGSVDEQKIKEFYSFIKHYVGHARIHF